MARYRQLGIVPVRASGFRKWFKPPFQQASARATIRQAPRWTGQNLHLGNFLPSERTRGVAQAHTSQETALTKKRAAQLCCIPTARIPTTICVPLTRPMQSQNRAIQTGDISFTLTVSRRARLRIAAKPRKRAASGLARNAALAE